MLTKENQYTIVSAAATFLLFLIFAYSCSQNRQKKSHLSVHTDSLNYGKLYGLALKGQVANVLSILDTVSLNTKKDSVFKTRYEKRFKYKIDETNFLAQKDSELRPILKIFQRYWRKELLHPDSNYDKTIKNNLITLFHKTNKLASFTTENINDNTLEDVFMYYLKSKDLYTTGFGKTGKYYDLLVWRTMKPKTHEVALLDDTVSVDVYLMKNFISLGWEAYATFGKLYPGAWTTDEAIYVVANAYDIQSEDFKVHFLKHETQHFSDMRRFPKLSNKDLEYRAKLTEIYYSNDELYEQINTFINRAKYDPDRPHPFADYCLIKDISQVLFDKNYVKDINKWEKKSPESIHNAAKLIYFKNTKQLNRIGKDVMHYLGKYEKCGDYNL